MSPVLRVEGVGKSYKRYASRWSRLLEWLTGRPRHQLLPVLRDLDFTLGQSEAVGIVGRNGAGKSTLLKIIAGTTRPSQGQVVTEGHVAALLELGMGFHPDFNGRENAVIGCQLLGLGGEQIEALLPEIEAFAEIGDYFERPVRQYSSGMQMRLAFAVATAVRPDLLVVDEALSVGDAYFQHKSINRIREFQRQGTSLLLVSHDPAAILSLCERAILIDGGAVAKDGPAEEVLDHYNAILSESGRSSVRVERLQDGRARTISGSGEASVERIGLFSGEGEPLEVIAVGQTVRLELDVRIHRDIDDLVVGYMLKDRLGRALFGTNTHHLRLQLDQTRSGRLARLSFTFAANLGPGAYSISTALHVGDTHHAANYEWRDLALLFQVANLGKTPFIGVNWLPPEARVDWE